MIRVFVFLGLLLAALLAGGGRGGAAPRGPGAPTATPAPTPADAATVEWDLWPDADSPVPTLLLPAAPLGPRETGVCAVWDGAGHKLTLYRVPAPPTTTICYPAKKVIRVLDQAGTRQTALWWGWGTTPIFVQYLRYPGDRLPYAVGADGGLVVQLP